MRVRELKRDVGVMLYSFLGAPMALANEAMAWFNDVTRDGMPTTERILEVQMGLVAKEPVWHSAGLTGLARELNAEEQEIAALHKCLATKQAGQVAVDEDESAAQQRTQ